MIISAVLSEKPLIEGNSVTLPICKVGTKAYDRKGKEYILTREALESGASSWTGGIVTINHMVKEKGTITKSWFEDPYVYATFEDLSQETIDAINSAAYRGVSQESEPLEIKGSDVLKLKGTGSTFVFYPFKPACPMKEGCGLPIASTLAVMETDFERHEFDVAIENNVGRIVKLREMTVYLDRSDASDEDVLKKRILQEVMFIGAGQYMVFDRDTSLEEGDEIPEGREPVHTVTITVSMLQSFNFPLNTHTENFDVDTPGGVNITEADQIAKLESTISDLKAENKNLKSTIDELRQELKDKDAKLESTVNTAVKTALESHDKQLKEQTERESILTELKSSVSEETLAGFKDVPVSALKSTLAAIKETAGKHVGANNGTGVQSTKGDDIDYASLGVTSIEVE